MKNMNNQEKNTYVRQHILSALLELMHTQDFVSISIQALVDAAGVGRASFYRNFASKEDVLQQESVRLTNEWKTNFDHEHPDGTPGQDNLWLVSLLDFYKDHAEFYLALYHAGLRLQWLGNNDTRIREHPSKEARPSPILSFSADGRAVGA